MAKRYVVRDGKIYARVIYFDSAGKKRQLWRRAESKSEAKEMARDLAHSIKQSGSETFEHQLNLTQYLDKWLKSLRVSERTYSSYETLLRLYVRPLLGKKKVTAIRPLDVQDLIDSLNDRKLSPKTVRETHMVFSRSLRQAVRWRLITFNPAQDALLPKRVKTEMKTLTPEQAQKFLVAVAKDKYGLIFELALWTGMRPEEYLGLQWVDVDLKVGTITVQRAMLFNRKGGGWYFKEPKVLRSLEATTSPDWGDLRGWHPFLDEIIEFGWPWNERRLTTNPNSSEDNDRQRAWRMTQPATRISSLSVVEELTASGHGPRLISLYNARYSRQKQRRRRWLVFEPFAELFILGLLSDGIGNSSKDWLRLARGEKIPMPSLKPTTDAGSEHNIPENVPAPSTRSQLRFEVH